MSKLQVLFLLENLGGGGAERVLPNLLKYLDRDRFSVTVLTLFQDGINRSRLPQDINYISRQAPCFRGITYIVKYLSAGFLYKHYIQKICAGLEFDILIAYMHGLPIKVLAGAPNGKKVAWIHGDMMGGYKPHFPKYFVSTKNMLRCLAKFDAFVGVSERVVQSFKQFLGIDNDVHLIHNTNDIEEIQSLASGQNPYSTSLFIPNIISVGHLTRVKGNDRLLQAALRLKNEGFDFTITILGEGEERLELEKYIAENHLDSYIKLPGFVDNPYPFIAHADLYICPSHSEGFSTAVSEAIILGIPVISTDVSGAREMLGENNDFGLVCDNSEEGIYQTLRKMLADQKLLLHYRQKSQERASFFQPAHTVGAVEELLTKVANK